MNATRINMNYELFNMNYDLFNMYYELLYPYSRRKFLELPHVGFVLQ